MPFLAPMIVVTPTLCWNQNLDIIEILYRSLIVYVKKVARMLYVLIHQWYFNWYNIGTTHLQQNLGGMKFNFKTNFGILLNSTKSKGLWIWKVFA
jgi:hypothetical protein